MFYPDKKPHISPSAFQAWHKQKSLFVRSYFKGEKTPENSAMKAGKKIHGLIEGGLLEVANRFDKHEDTIEVTLGDTGVKALGIPDSYEKAEKETISFVDYKTGKENSWTREKIASDLKMMFTAWLVLQTNPTAKHVRAIVEWIGTEWNGAELVPTGESESIEYTFTWNDLFEFDKLIKSTIDQVNEAYEQFLEQEGQEFSIAESDVEEYAKLDAEKKEIDGKMKEIKERIGEQLSFAGKDNYEHELGSFYFTTRKTYEYPDDLEFQTESGQLMTFAVGEEVVLAMGAAKKHYELSHEPKSISKSVGFRPKKKK